MTCKMIKHLCRQFCILFLLYTYIFSHILTTIELAFRSLLLVPFSFIPLFTYSPYLFLRYDNFLLFFLILKHDHARCVACIFAHDFGIRVLFSSFDLKFYILASCLPKYVWFNKHSYINLHNSYSDLVDLSIPCINAYKIDFKLKKNL